MARGDWVLTVYCVKSQSNLPIPLNSHRQARVTAAQTTDKRRNEVLPGQSGPHNPNHQPCQSGAKIIRQWETILLSATVRLSRGRGLGKASIRSSEKSNHAISTTGWNPEHSWRCPCVYWNWLNIAGDAKTQSGREELLCGENTLHLRSVLTE